jgi:hypothetical protein
VRGIGSGSAASHEAGKDQVIMFYATDILLDLIKRRENNTPRCVLYRTARSTPYFYQSISHWHFPPPSIFENGMVDRQKQVSGVSRKDKERISLAAYRGDGRTDHVGETDGLQRRRVDKRAEPERSRGER